MRTERQFRISQTVGKIWNFSGTTGSTEKAQARSVRQWLATLPHTGSSRRRLWTIILSLETKMSAKQIASYLQISRTTVFAYRKLYAECGTAWLLFRTRAGRPAKRILPALDEVIAQGLHMLRWLHLPTLRDWIHHHGLTCPDWILRRRVRDLIKESEFYYLINRSEARLRKQPPLWRRPPKVDGMVFNFVVEDSPGLRSWHDVAVLQKSESSKFRPWEAANEREARIFPKVGTPRGIWQTELPLCA